ncbi:hypothetical protein E0L36_12860 [Streptomyces sp. AJS327]|nr:hypothetical protein [Streptomyces sp. AJS327]
MPAQPIRVEKGHASEEELAAVTALLLARTHAPARAADNRPASKPRWRRLDSHHGHHGYQSPRSWHS